MGLFTKGINKIKPDDDNFDEDDPTNTVLVRHIVNLVIPVRHTDLNNIKHRKKDKRRINAYNLASNKSVGLVYDRT